MFFLGYYTFFSLCRIINKETLRSSFSSAPQRPLRETHLRETQILLPVYKNKSAEKLPFLCSSAPSA